jgi:uncharacterized protein (DUF983 family)
MDKKNNNGCAFYFGGGIWGILFLIMFVMKTMGLGAVANWSWWLVTAPIWGPFAIVLCIALILSLIAGLFYFITSFFD